MNTNPSTPGTPSVTAPTDASPVTFSREDFTLLSYLAPALDCLEKGDDIQEAANQLNQLKEKLSYLYRLMEELPGSDLSRNQQKILLSKDTEELKLKKTQLERYLSFPIFKGSQSDVPKTEE
ncbi:hypothetical protein K7432_015882 [Basidiobolus ranarum]|uniref:Mediator of RNA polymerase II transcription subunit 9 n=1 Tax=Basidiobolus ranarum TaxID=34480 RepID=A0ABR2VMF1_9FUNG